MYGTAAARGETAQSPPLPVSVPPDGRTAAYELRRPRWRDNRTQPRTRGPGAAPPHGGGRVAAGRLPDAASGRRRDRGVRRSAVGPVRAAFTLVRGRAASAPRLGSVGPRRAAPGAAARKLCADSRDRINVSRCACNKHDHDDMQQNPEEQTAVLALRYTALRTSWSHTGELEAAHRPRLGYR